MKAYVLITPIQLQTTIGLTIEVGPSSVDSHLYSLPTSIPLTAKIGGLPRRAFLAIEACIAMILCKETFLQSPLSILSMHPQSLLVTKSIEILVRSDASSSTTKSWSSLFSLLYYTSWEGDTMILIFLLSYKASCLGWGPCLWLFYAKCHPPPIHHRSLSRDGEPLPCDVSTSIVEPISSHPP